MQGCQVILLNLDSLVQFKKLNAFIKSVKKMLKSTF